MTRTILFAAILAGTVSTAFAQSGTIPNPADPTPAFPIATDGTPLPPVFGTRRGAVPAEGFVGLFTGRSIFEAQPTR